MVSHPETGSDSPIGSDQDRGRDILSLDFKNLSSCTSCTFVSQILEKMTLCQLLSLFSLTFAKIPLVSFCLDFDTWLNLSRPFPSSL